MRVGVAQTRLSGISHRDAGRVAALVLAALGFGLSGIDGGIAGAVIRTAALLFSAGFAALDATDALPESATGSPHQWVLIVPVSIAVNVVIGTALAVFGPAFSPAWTQGFSALFTGSAIGAGLLSRRLA